VSTLPPELLHTLLDSLLACGGDFAEVYSERRLSTSVRFDDGRVEEASVGEDAGVALRLVAGDRTLFASGNRGDADGLLEAARKLAAALGAERRLHPAPFRPPAGRPAPPIARRPLDVPLAEKVEAVRAADRGARAFDPRVRQVTAVYLDSEQQVRIATSEGVCEDDRRTYTTLYCTAIARQAEDTRSGTEVIAEARGFDLFDAHRPYGVGREAARLAVLQLDAVPAPAGTFTVVLGSSAGGTMVHEACGHGLEGDFVKKGLSIYAGRVGEKVAADTISVVDDGTLAYCRGSSMIDDEGEPTRRVVLIENGVLRGFLHSRRSALELGAPRTGNGRRQSYRYPPIPRMRNTMILPGEDDPEEIVRSVADGILVSRMGGGEVDITSGKFVFAVSEAYRIRAGVIAEPLRDATLIGTGPDVLASIDRVGRDLGFGVGTCGKDGQGVPVADAQPTLRIPRIVVGGVAGPEAG